MWLARCSTACCHPDTDLHDVLGIQVLVTKAGRQRPAGRSRLRGMAEGLRNRRIGVRSSAERARRSNLAAASDRQAGTTCKLSLLGISGAVGFVRPMSQPQEQMFAILENRVRSAARND